MLGYESLVGDQEDWAQFITNVEMRQTPVLDWLEVDSAPVKRVKLEYQAEKWRDVRDNAHIDGRPWETFQSVGEGRAELQSLIQWFDTTGQISKLAEDVSDIAGIADQMAREIPKSLKEMQQDIEAALCDSRDCQFGQTLTLPYKTRGIGSWVDSAAQGALPVPDEFRPPAASISTAASATLTENMIRDILESMQDQAKQPETIDGFVGSSLKRKFSDFQLYVPSSVSTQQSGTVFNQDGDSREVTRAVDVYHSDFGTLKLHLTYWLMALTGTAVQRKWAGYFLHKRMWSVKWKQKPQVYKPEFKGGSYEFAADCIMMMICWNPRAEGKYAPTA